ncbi:MAG: hypothetical protein H0U98_01040 [Alphaproteobacteria bacterium]|nr:hypothetical protein [Alphaproteobacteria bacterium]
MAIIVLLAVGAVVLALAIFPKDKPTELDADVWVADPEERARNLKRKTEAWRAGQAYFSPAAIAKIEADCTAARERPFSPTDFVPAPVQRAPAAPVRRHPMRPAT